MNKSEATFKQIPRHSQTAATWCCRVGRRDDRSESSLRERLDARQRNARQLEPRVPVPPRGHARGRDHLLAGRPRHGCQPGAHGAHSRQTTATQVISQL